MGKRRSRKSRPNSNGYRVDDVLSDINYEYDRNFPEIKEKLRAEYEGQLRDMRADYEQRLSEAKRQYEADLNKAVDRAFVMMLYLPVEVLIQTYWPHSRPIKVVRYIEQVLDLYTAFNDGRVDFEEINRIVKEKCGITIESIAGEL